MPKGFLLKRIDRIEPGEIFLPNPRVRAFQHERDLVKRLWDYGFAVMRAPASGSKAKRIAYPDIVAIYKGKVIACEVKTMKKTRSIYLDGLQVEKLIEFSRRAGGDAFIAIKIVGSGSWLFIPIDKLEKVDDKRYKLTKDLMNSGLHLEALVSIIKGVRRLTEFHE